MNQYIITEEELGGIIDITEDMCIQEGWVKEVVPLAQKRMSIINKVRSRPYQSERETVLELLRLKYVEFLNHPCPELADKYKHCCDAEWCGLCTLDEVLAELRQAGEP